MLREYYIRKQTLANCERYITPKLKEIENTILGASERALSLEAHVFEQVRAEAAKERAEERIRSHAAEVDIKRAEFALRKALIRIDVKEAR